MSTEPKEPSQRQPLPRFSIMQAVQLRGQYCERGRKMRDLITGSYYSEVVGAWMHDIEWQDDATSMFEFDLEPATL